ncbi:hypothetical protein Q31b_18990 [Novipirellula aureliae]|uniref:Uncharacterized protein n=2 Tax=Novipirellula aureliae TaxID=2527966 RepID=A0A5C6E3X0_9BACT|nr:hypothetical protein Q31b_18990 [Novipirellula aureliae]
MLGVLLLGAIGSAQSNDNPFSEPQKIADSEMGRDQPDFQPIVSEPTDQEQKLAVELQRLQNMASRIGTKHPSMKSVQARISLIEQQLSDLAKNRQVDAAGLERPTAATILELNDPQLRQLILRMAIKINELENRIEILEQASAVR